MEFLKRLFRPKQEEVSSPNPSLPSSPGYQPIRNTEPATRRVERPIDPVFEALESFEKGDFLRAEKLFRAGIERTKTSTDRFNHHFALGRYAHFLIETNRHDEAIAILEESVSLGTDIPASYSDLMGIYAGRGQEDELFRVADRYAERCPESTEKIAHYLISSAIRTNQVLDYEAVDNRLLRAEGWALKHGLKDVRFKAWGERGHNLERSGDTEKARLLYQRAIDAGSRDRKTFTRLLMLLEKGKKFEEATDLAQFGLGVQTDAAWEEDQRKRLARFEAKSSPKTKRKREQVPAFSIREGVNRLQLVEQIHVTYGARYIALSPDHEALLISKGSSKPGNLVSRRLDNGVEEWTQSFPKASTPVYSLPDGGYLAILESGRVGDGSCEMHWLDPNGNTNQVATIPDKYTEVAVSSTGLAIGCRDGYLYFFGLSGELKWKHKASQAVQIPGPEPYSVPCPYFLASSHDGSGIAYSSWDTVTYVSHRGRREWTWTAEQNTTSYTLTVPLEKGKASSKYFKVLGVSRSASEQEVQKAFRKKSKETHPDLHPNNPNAAAEFREVVAAFEAISSGEANPKGSGHQITISVTGPPSTVYDVVMARDGHSLVTATSDGSISVIDRSGRVFQRFVAAAGAGNLAASSDLSQIVYSHWTGINFYDRRGLTNTHNLDGLTDLFLSPSAKVVAATQKKNLYLFEISGKKIARIESARNITDVVFRDDSEIIIASGKLIRLRIK